MIKLAAAKKIKSQKKRVKEIIHQIKNAIRSQSNFLLLKSRDLVIFFACKRRIVRQKSVGRFWHLHQTRMFVRLRDIIVILIKPRVFAVHPLPEWQKSNQIFYE